MATKKVKKGVAPGDKVYFPEAVLLTFTREGRISQEESLGPNLGAFTVVADEELTWAISPIQRKITPRGVEEAGAHCKPWPQDDGRAA